MNIVEGHILIRDLKDTSRVIRINLKKKKEENKNWKKIAFPLPAVIVPNHLSWKNNCIFMLNRAIKRLSVKFVVGFLMESII